MPQKRRRQKGRANAPGRSPLGRWTGLSVLLLATAGTVLVGLLVVSVVGGPGEPKGDRDTRFPAYAYNSAATLSGYKVASRVPEALLAVPCYCGCGPGQGHVSLNECFISPDGPFTDHASNCHLCVEEAVDVGKWYDDGLALKDIRSRIEQKYSGHGPPTDTPPIA